MDVVVYRKGEAVGTLRASDDGLYRVLRATLPMSRELLRLYFPDRRAFGVFVPEDGALVCCRRVSRSSLPALPAYAAAWCDADGQWEQADGELRRWTPVGLERAVLWQTEKPMAFPAAPERLHPVKIGLSIYLCASERYQ